MGEKYQFLGAEAESMVSKELLRLDPSKYVVLSNILLPVKGKVGTSQIDHIVVSNFGIFCIGTKAHKGLIIGNQKSPFWGQVLGNTYQRFNSPVRQNYGHIKAMEQLVENLPRKSWVDIYNVIAFPNANKLDIEGNESSVTGSELLNWIGRYQRETISNEDKYNIVYTLWLANISDQKERQKHYKRVGALIKTRV